jgi:hypothetical protein
MEREKLNWRSFTDKGKITARWNDPATPCYYIIDPKGVIRHKWAGGPAEKAIDAALEKLLKEAEKEGKKSAK